MMINESYQFDSSTEFVQFVCLESDYSMIPVEWLDPSRNVMTGNSHGDIIGILM